LSDAKKLFLAASKTKELPQDVRQELKKMKRSTSQKDEKSRVLFKFEYEGDDGEVRSILVREVR
jgi:ABC-type hemin transport system substrate-binding protein